MQVFRLYFKLIRKVFPSLAIYLGIFLVLAIGFTFLGSDSEQAAFSQEGIKLTIINRDGPSAVVDGLAEHLGTSNTLVELPDDIETLQDAIYYRNVSYILIVPDGFSQGFAQGKNVALDKISIPDTTEGMYADTLINQYLATAQLYQKALHDPDRAVQATLEDLQAQTPVSLQNTSLAGEETAGYIFYFKFLAYVLLGMVILGLGTIMMHFNEPNLQRRNLCSPLTLRSINLQLAMGNGIFTLACWLLLTLTGLILYKGALLQSGLLGLLSLNALVFSVVCASLGFLIGIFVRNATVQSAISNVLTLGMSFLCGVFVPRSVMSSSVLAVSKFLPAYWYVDALENIAGLTRIDTASLQPIFQALGIQLAFAAAIFSIGLLLSRQRRISR